MKGVAKFLGVDSNLKLSNLVYDNDKKFYCLRGNLGGVDASRAVGMNRYKSENEISSIGVHKIHTTLINDFNSKSYVIEDKDKESNNTCLGISKGRHKVKLPPRIRRMALEFFRPENEKFFQIIGRRFNWNK